MRRPIEHFQCRRDGHFVWRNVGAEACATVALFQERAVATDSHVYIVGVIAGLRFANQDLAYSTGVDLLDLMIELRFQAGMRVSEVKRVQVIQVPRLVPADGVQIVFHLGGKCVIHQSGQVLFHELGHGKRHPVRHECVASLENILAGQDRFDNRGVCTRPTNSFAL